MLTYLYPKLVEFLPDKNTLVRFANVLRLPLAAGYEHLMLVNAAS